MRIDQRPMTYCQVLNRKKSFIGHWSILICRLETKLQLRASMEEHKSRADHLEERLVAFAARIVSFSGKLPKTPPGRHIAFQILRSGTAGAANYGEARGAESRADFIHKLRIVEKELNETAIWLRIVAKSSLVEAELIVDILAENMELAKIVSASVKTARTRSLPEMTNGN